MLTSVLFQNTDANGLSGSSIISLPNPKFESTIIENIFVFSLLLNQIFKMNQTKK